MTKLINTLKSGKRVSLGEYAEDLIPIDLKGATYSNNDYKLKKTALATLRKARVLRDSNAIKTIQELVRLAKKRAWGNVDKKITTSLTNIIKQDLIEEVKDYANATNKPVMAEWIASSSDNPDPDHEKNYGEIFDINEGINGELPGERYGCQCSFRLIDD